MATENAVLPLVDFFESIALWLSTYWVSLVAIFIPASAAFISFITLWYQRKRFRLNGLAEAFRLLNDLRHREARKVVYNIGSCYAPSEASFNIIGIKATTSKGASNQEDLERVCKEIVKNDCNEIGVLARYGLVDDTSIPGLFDQLLYHRAMPFLKKYITL